MKDKYEGLLIAGVILFLGAVCILVWWVYFRTLPLLGFASGNGRLEATEVDIATKFHGRVEDLLFDEGDRVESGQIVARMDTASLETQLAEAQASVVRAETQLCNCYSCATRKRM